MFLNIYVTASMDRRHHIIKFLKTGQSPLLSSLINMALYFERRINKNALLGFRLFFFGDFAHWDMLFCMSYLLYFTA